MGWLLGAVLAIGVRDVDDCGGVWGVWLDDVAICLLSVTAVI